VDLLHYYHLIPTHHLSIPPGPNLPPSLSLSPQPPLSPQPTLSPQLTLSRQPTLSPNINMDSFDFSIFTLQQLHELQQALKMEITVRETNEKLVQYKNQLNQGYPVFTIDHIEGLGPEYKSTRINVPVIAGSDTRSKSRDDIEDSVYFRYIDEDFGLVNDVDFVRNHMDRFEIEDIDIEDHDSPIHVTGYIPITITSLPMIIILNKEHGIHECWCTEWHGDGSALLVPNGDSYQLYGISKKPSDFEYKGRHYTKIDDNYLEYINDLIPIENSIRD
jgi:hypothetical protein